MLSEYWYIQPVMSKRSGPILNCMLSFLGRFQAVWFKRFLPNIYYKIQDTLFFVTLRGTEMFKSHLPA